MSEFTVNVFRVHDRYLFAHYFDDGDLFQELDTFYSPDRYRFEVPTEAELDDVRDTLAAYGYDVNMVDDLTPYCVVMPTTAQYGDVLRDAVAHDTVGDHRILLMKDRAKAEQAEIHGATPIADTDLTPPF